MTPRLVLHPLTPAEAERVAARTPEPGDRWAPGYPREDDVDGARLFLAACAVSGEPWPFGTYEIRRREDGRAIGTAGFHGPPDAGGEVAVGYGLVPQARRRGYAAEALRALLDVARRQGVQCVTGDTEADNTASRRTMSAAGMQLVREDARLAHYAVRFPAADGG
ncbi:GNAT family N-acetyltransferase [Streptomyces sp. TR02-1]|uniref:GNAT family N-acetyltransferase n=1 Tax=Streptomyces sp. TR02-1 TaxID=3385977 RepID=UPI0039A1EEB1